MPPQGWDEDSITGSEFGGDCRRLRLTKSRKALEVRLVQPHQTHRRAGRREVERADVEGRDPVRRKQRESPPTAYHAADVVPFIEVRGRGDRRAEPDARQHIAVEDAERILRGESRQAVPHQRTLRGYRRRARERR